MNPNPASSISESASHTPSDGQAASACESACSYFALEAAPIGNGRASLVKL